MTIQNDVLTAMKIFTARLDDATDEWNRGGTDAAYLGRQTILLTDLMAVVCGSLMALADRVDTVERRPNQGG